VNDRILRFHEVSDDRRLQLQSAGWLSGKEARARRAAARAANILPRDQLRSLPDTAKANGTGIYFLWRGPQLLYIGKAEDVSRRVVRHRSDKRFTRATFLAIPFEMNRQAEKAYCSHYRAPGNKTRFG
jgi:hypothetical protein